MKPILEPPSLLLPLTALPTSFHPAAAAILQPQYVFFQFNQCQACLVIRSRYATLVDVASLSKLSIQSSLFKTCKSSSGRIKPSSRSMGPQSEKIKRQAFHRFNPSFRVATVELCCTLSHRGVCYIFSSHPPFPVPIGPSSTHTPNTEDL
ncbi:hypothetical protein B0H14DRAFT_2705077, partial [Mycena olivaceomarginata]